MANPRFLPGQGDPPVRLPRPRIARPSSTMTIAENNMYESHYVAHFFRLWGATESAKGIDPEDVLLGNSQNDFDALFGDVVGKVGTRFFLIEFKRDRSGFAAEVAPSGKVHRQALYQHLRDDPACRRLAAVGHFAAYCDAATNKLAFEPYAHAIAPRTPRPAPPKKAVHILDHQDWCHDFKKFYSNLTATDDRKHDELPEFFAVGLGLDRASLSCYIECMYRHLKAGTDEKGHATLGVYDSTTKNFRTFHGTVVELVQRLHIAYTQMQKHIVANASQPPSPTPSASLAPHAPQAPRGKGPRPPGG